VSSEKPQATKRKKTREKERVQLTRSSVALRRSGKIRPGTATHDARNRCAAKQSGPWGRKSSRKKKKEGKKARAPYPKKNTREQKVKRKFKKQQVK